MSLVDKMLAHEGVYVVCTYMTRTIVEVEKDGTCHQIRLSTKQRDGVLDREGWNEESIIDIVGPLGHFKDAR